MDTLWGRIGYGGAPHPAGRIAWIGSTTVGTGAAAWGRFGSQVVWEWCQNACFLGCLATPVLSPCRSATWRRRNRRVRGRSGSAGGRKRRTSCWRPAGILRQRTESARWSDPPPFECSTRTRSNCPTSPSVGMFQPVWVLFFFNPCWISIRFRPATLQSIPNQISIIINKFLLCNQSYWLRQQRNSARHRINRTRDSH